MTLPPIELRLLGTLDIGGPAVEPRAPGDAPHLLLRQPKRTAVLFFMLLEDDTAMVSRDRLTEVFWSADAARDGRVALRQALRFLRAALPEGAILRRGNRSVGVDPAKVGCDVLRFRELLESGSPAEALELYRGDLLEGFVVDAGPTFDRWLAGLRDGLRSAAAAAAWDLATRAEEAGRTSEAVFWARRELALAPGDEDSVRPAMALLARAGHPDGALAAYRVLEERLGREGGAPAPLTRRVAEEAEGLGPEESLGGGGGRRTGVDRRDEEDRREEELPVEGADRRETDDRRTGDERRYEEDRRSGRERRRGPHG